MSTPSADRHSATRPLPNPGSPQQTCLAEATPAQNATGRAFAGITLFGAALLVVGSFVPWAQVYDSYYGWTSITTPFVQRSGMPTDAAVTLGLGLATACVGAVRLAIVVPRWLRITQIVVAGLLTVGLVSDWTTVVEKELSPAGGLIMAIAGAVIVAVGGFPLVRSAAAGDNLGSSRARASGDMRTAQIPTQRVSAEPAKSKPPRAVKTRRVARPPRPQNELGWGFFGLIVFVVLAIIILIPLALL